jgi:hypothetical protein
LLHYLRDVLNTSDVALTWSLWRFAQLPVKQCLSPKLPPGLPFGPVIYLLAPISLIRPPANLLWYAIALHYQFPRLLTTERCPIAVAHLIQYIAQASNVG